MFYGRTEPPFPHPKNRTLKHSLAVTFTLNCTHTHSLIHSLTLAAPSAQPQNAFLIKLIAANAKLKSLT